MSAEARANGWRGFTDLGRRAPGGYAYGCDGMPTLSGCGEELVTRRPLARVGTKGTGWYVCFGTDAKGTEDRDVVLTFCPRCAAIVKAQERRPATPPEVLSMEVQR